MVNYLSNPNLKVTVGSTDFEGENVKTVKVIRNENGFDTATVTFADPLAELRSIVVKDAAILAYVKEYNAGAWTTLLNGIIRYVPEAKGVLTAKCDGSGYGFAETACAQEYGTQSVHPTLDTLKVIIENADYGIVPKYVNDILCTGTGSGFNYTTVVDVITSLIHIPYLYYPFKPCNKALNDLISLVQALKGAIAGPHWIVTTDNKLLVTTVANHSAAAITEGWTTYLGGSQAEATLEQGIDFKAFNFDTLSKQTNYVLYHGTFRKPADGDQWTEGNSNLWAATNGLAANEGTIVKVGTYSLRFAPTNAAGSWLTYPSALNAAWNLTKCGGKYNIPDLSFWVYNGTGAPFTVYLTTAGVGYFQLNSLLNPPANTWINYRIPIGTYAKSSDESVYWVPTVITGQPSWSQIDGITFICYNSSGYIYFDGLRFNGHVIRVARETTIDANNKLRMKVVSDDMGKDDSLVASDATGTMGLLAYSELLRLQSTPTVGAVKTPMIKDLLPGQFVHLHARPNSAGTFQIDADYRATRLTHTIQVGKTTGCETRIEVTSDLTNAVARAAYDSMNEQLSSIRPEFQDRQASSQKMRDIDITQAILEKSY